MYTSSLCSEINDQKKWVLCIINKTLYQMNRRLSCMWVWIIFIDFHTLTYLLQALTENIFCNDGHCCKQRRLLHMFRIGTLFSRKQLLNRRLYSIASIYFEIVGVFDLLDLLNTFSFIIISTFYMYK